MQMCTIFNIQSPVYHYAILTETSWHVSFHIPITVSPKHELSINAVVFITRKKDMGVKKIFLHLLIMVSVLTEYETLGFCQLWTQNQKQRTLPHPSLLNIGLCRFVSFWTRIKSKEPPPKK